MAHTKPHGDMSAAQLVALFYDADRHPKALAHELRCAKLPALTALALEQVPAPAALVEDALDELARRQSAVARLLADNPMLAAVGR